MWVFARAGPRPRALTRYVPFDAPEKLEVDPDLAGIAGFFAHKNVCKSMRQLYALEISKIEVNGQLVV